MIRKTLGYAVLLPLLMGSLPSAASAAGEKILVFKDSLTYNGHTAAIAAAMAKLKTWAAANAFTYDTTSKFTSFNTANLAQYDAVILMYPEKATKADPGTGISDTMSAEQDSAFKSWFLTGKGYIGVHCDTRQNPNWPWWYQTLVGAKYVEDVGPVSSKFHVADTSDPITKGMPANFTGNEQLRIDSLFFTESDTNYKVLVRGDISDYVANRAANMAKLGPWVNTSTVVPWMPFFPFVYKHNLEGGRVFHLAPGHNATTWTASNSNWNNMFLYGILYALNRPGYGGTSTPIARGKPPVAFSLDADAESHSLRFGIPKKARVVIEVYNLKGRRVSTLANRSYNGGSYSVPLPDGPQGSIYLLDFRAGNYHRTLKIAPGVHI
ncbi:MAG TPA: ThuA domain-containing protein [Fibrobacteria bacterium]|jgi:type 1 glutamine amidotransferase|nr:ThuA domain-containing protein [Fibrobacteria bacterium]